MKILHILYSGLGGHGNVFFSMTDADCENEFSYEGLFFGIEEIREQYIKKASDRNMPWHYIRKKPGLDLTSYRNIVRIIKSSKPDILLLHSSAYIFPAKFASWFSSFKIKIIIRETQPNHLKSKAEWIGLWFSLMAADKIVYLSNEYKDAIKGKFPVLFSEKRTRVIPNGIDLGIFKPLPHEQTNIIKIGMQSRLSATKDHSTLVKAYGILLNKLQGKAKIQLFIAGDGECRVELEKLVRELALENKVVFTGLLEESELPRFINSLDIYVHATMGETMSTAIMQVMACRVPVIASDVLGVNNMIKHGETGLLVPVKDEDKLAEALYFIMENPAVSEVMNDKANRFAVDNYSNKRMFESYRDIFLG